MKHFLSKGDYKPYKKYQLTPTQMANGPASVSSNVSENDCLSLDAIHLDIPNGSNKIDKSTFQHHANRINRWLQVK
jgi:hypothetical protein